MNKINLFLLALLLSCAQKDKEAINTKQKLIDESTRLHGYWLSDSYLKAVEKNKSIYASNGNYNIVWGFTLDKENLISKYPVLNGFTEHEGGYACILKYDSLKNRFVNNTIEGRYSAIKESFELSLLNTNLLELRFADRVEVYRKITDEQTELRRILFEGTFKKATNPNEFIQFKKNGEVTGMDSLKYFSLIYDFVEGINYDACILTKKPDDFWANGEVYHYKINKDTLLLYTINLDTLGMDHKIGALSYLLNKTN